MAFQSNVELVNQAVQALADTAPPDWEKLILYSEFLEDKEIGLRRSFTGRALGGEHFDVRLDGCPVGNSMKSISSIQALYTEACQQGERWNGILLTVFRDGQFKCRFYYDKTPLLNNEDALLKQIMSEGMSDVPNTRTKSNCQVMSTSRQRRKVGTEPAPLGADSKRPRTGKRSSRRPLFPR
jgi:hypothetical protein